MSCQNSLYVLQALVIVNLLACSFNLFSVKFLSPHKKKEKKEGGGREGGKKGYKKKVLILKEVPT